MSNPSLNANEINEEYSTTCAEIGEMEHTIRQLKASVNKKHEYIQSLSVMMRNLELEKQGAKDVE